MKKSKWKLVEKEIRQYIDAKEFQKALDLLRQSAIEKDNLLLRLDVEDLQNEWDAFEKKKKKGKLSPEDIQSEEYHFACKLEYCIECLNKGGASASSGAVAGIESVNSESGPTMSGASAPPIFDIEPSRIILPPKPAPMPVPIPIKSGAKPTKVGAKPPKKSAKPPAKPQNTDVTSRDNREGGILYNIPNKMQLGVQNKCIVRLAFDKTQLIRDTDTFTDEVIKTVQVSDIMEVDLIDISGEGAFNIQFVSQKEQTVDRSGATEWLIMVKALKAGSFSLVLKVAIIENIDGKDRRKEMILEELVAVVGEAVAPSTAFKSPNQPFQPVGVQTLMPNMQQKTVLFMGANPPGTTFLQLEIEHSRISFELEGNFRFPTAKFLSAVEMPKLFIVHKPNVVHFSGHGKDPSVNGDEKGGGRSIKRISKDEVPSGGIVVFDNDMRGMKVLEDKVLDIIFANAVQKLKIPIEVVVFNSCYSESQAKVVGKSVPYVVGTSRAIKDEIAIGFAVGFYFGLANGLSVEDAFTTGKTEAVIADIEAENLIVLYKNGVKMVL
jgi:hypothetical protein